MWLVDCSRANIFQMTTFHNGHKVLNNLCACINLNVWTCQKLSCRCRQDYKVNQPESYGKCLCGPRGNPVDMCSWDEIEWYRPKNQQFAIVDEIPKGKLWINILSSLKLTANNAPENWCKRKTIFLAFFWERRNTAGANCEFPGGYPPLVQAEEWPAAVEVSWRIIQLSWVVDVDEDQPSSWANNDQTRRVVTPK